MFQKHVHSDHRIFNFNHFVHIGHISFLSSYCLLAFTLSPDISLHTSPLIIYLWPPTISSSKLSTHDHKFQLLLCTTASFLLSSFSSATLVRRQVVLTKSYLFYPAGIRKSVWRQGSVIFISAVTHLWFTADAFSLEGVSHGSRATSRLTVRTLEKQSLHLWDVMQHTHTGSL